MLFSMTGFGEARATGPGFSLTVEVRAVNNRHLKVTVRGSDPYPQLEAEVEKVVRRTVRRGTVQVRVHVSREAGSADTTLNTALLRAYFEQLRAEFPPPAPAPRPPGTPPPPANGSSSVLATYGPVFAALIGLPGVVAEGRSSGGPPEEEWPLVERTLEQALAKLDATRKDEGRAMAQELSLHHRHLTDQLELVRQHLPAVMSDYRTRLLERIKQAVADSGVAVGPDHLIREIALFADRTDVAEEVTRFAAHLDTFADLVRAGAEGAGRRLEFVIQEMGREANTLGSKAGDVTISRHAVEIKATLEKIRELVQNVE